MKILDIHCFGFGYYCMINFFYTGIFTGALEIISAKFSYYHLFQRDRQVATVFLE